jgi:hypothetical protein
MHKGRRPPPEPDWLTLPLAWGILKAGRRLGLVAASQLFEPGHCHFQLELTF